MVPHWDRFCHAAVVQGCQAPGIQRLLNGLKILHMFHAAWCFLLKEPPCFICWMCISHHESNNNMLLQQTWPFLTDPDSKYLYRWLLKKYWKNLVCSATQLGLLNEKNTPTFANLFSPPNTKYRGDMKRNQKPSGVWQVDWRWIWVDARQQRNKPIVLSCPPRSRVVMLSA